MKEGKDFGSGSRQLKERVVEEPKLEVVGHLCEPFHRSGLLKQQQT